MDNVETSSVTSKSVMEKLKSLSSNLSKKATAGVDNISSTIDNESITITEESSSNILFTIFRYTLVILLIIFILLNLFSVFGILPPDIIKLFRPILFFLNPSPAKIPKHVTKKPVTLTDEPIEKKPKNKESIIDTIEKDIEHDIKDLKNLVVPDADNASSDIQSHKSKTGYCFVGKDQGYRSCVKVTDADNCMSGDIFPTKEVCINPSLRV